MNDRPTFGTKWWTQDAALLGPRLDYMLTLLERIVLLLEHPAVIVQSEPPKPTKRK